MLHFPTRDSLYFDGRSWDLDVDASSLLSLQCPCYKISLQKRLSPGETSISMSEAFLEVNPP